jgi:hypothetical protein
VEETAQSDIYGCLDLCYIRSDNHLLTVPKVFRNILSISFGSDFRLGPFVTASFRANLHNFEYPSESPVGFSVRPFFCSVIITFPNLLA